MSVICTELKPGVNVLVNTEPKDTGPPEGFIDSTVYRYKMIDGVKTLIGTQEPFPEGCNAKNNREGLMPENMMRGEGDMTKKVKLEVPKDIEQVWIEVNYSVNALANKYGVGWITAKKWLDEVGLTNKTQQTSEPARAATKEPDQSDMSADTSIPEKEITVKDVLLYELEQADEFCDKCGFYRPQCECEDDFTIEDDKPIPYTVAPGFDLAPIKIQLIAVALAEYRAEQLPAFIALRLVKAIGDIELGV